MSSKTSSCSASVACGSPGSRATETLRGQRLFLDEQQDLVMLGEGGLREPAQQREDLRSMGQVAQGKLSGDPGVSQDGVVVEQIGEDGVSGAQVVDPQRGIDQDHRAWLRRLGTPFRAGSVPPSRARRLALSLSTRARSASRTSAVFSLVPVSRWASASRSSSKASVVRINLAPLLKALE